MSDPTGPPFRLKLAEPRDILGAVPYLLGYHPTDSVVLVGLRERQLVVTACANLPESPQVARTLVRELADELRPGGVQEAILIGYGPDALVRALVPHLGAALADIGTELLDALRSQDGRYWSYLCTDPDCCPPDGQEYDVRDSRSAAEATMAG